MMIILLILAGLSFIGAVQLLGELAARRRELRAMKESPDYQDRQRRRRSR